MKLILYLIEFYILISNINSVPQTDTQAKQADAFNSEEWHKGQLEDFVGLQKDLEKITPPIRDAQNSIIPNVPVVNKKPLIVLDKEKPIVPVSKIKSKLDNKAKPAKPTKPILPVGDIMKVKQNNYYDPYYYYPYNNKEDIRINNYVYVRDYCKYYQCDDEDYYSDDYPHYPYDPY